MDSDPLTGALRRYLLAMRRAPPEGFQKETKEEEEAQGGSKVEGETSRGLAWPSLD